MLPSAIQLQYATFLLSVALGAMSFAPRPIPKAASRPTIPNV